MIESHTSVFKWRDVITHIILQWLRWYLRQIMFLTNLFGLATSRIPKDDSSFTAFFATSSATQQKLSLRYVEVENYRIRYLVAGEGEPVILVHGLSGSTRWWIRNVPRLAQYYRVYLVDLPGFGTMRRFRRRFALEKASSWLLAWMETIGVEQAHFLGHSMGGHICMRLAASRPDVVSRLVLVSPAAIPHVRSVFGYFVPLLIALRTLKPAFFLILSFDAIRAGPFMLLRATRELIAQDLRDEMKALNTPTLLVWGENDTLVPLSLGQILRDEIANSRLLILKKAGHVSMFDQPDEFNEAVLAFLRGETVGK